MVGMTTTEIMNYLPHRYPFLLVDKIVSYTLGETLVAIKNVTIAEPWFAGHFPNKPVMPGVLMIESLAQAAGVLAYLTSGFSPKEYLFYLASLDDVKFKRMVFPGDTLELSVKFLHQKRNFWKIFAQASVEGQVACSAQIMCAVRKEEKA